MEEIVIKKKGYNLHIIKTDKFKINNIDVCFTNNFNKSNYLSKLMMLEYIKSCSKKYSNNYKIKLALNDLYCAKLGSSIENNAGLSFTTISLKYFRDEFTENGNEIKCLEFLKEIIYNPTFRKTKENTLELDIIKNEYIDECNYKNNNVKAVASQEFRKIFFSDDSFNADSLVTKESIEKITLKDLENAYLDMINNDSMDIFIIGDFSDLILKKINNIFENNKVYKKYDLIKYNHEERDLIERINDYSKFKQSILKVGYKANLTHREYRYTYRILNYILGGGGLDSKLMKNVREKESICYSIYSNINPFYGTLSITAGISPNNFNKCKELIDKELDSIINGNFSDKDISDAKLNYLTVIEDLFDRYYSILDYYKLKYFLDLEDIENRKKEVNSITKSEVIELAKKFKKDTILLIKGDDSNE